MFDLAGEALWVVLALLPGYIMGTTWLSGLASVAGVMLATLLLGSLAIPALLSRTLARRRLDATLTTSRM